MSALRAESDRLMERMRGSEANVAELEADLSSAQEQVASKRAEADRCVPAASSEGQQDGQPGQSGPQPVCDRQR